MSGDEILADGMIFKNKKSTKDRLEVTIGDGMEFTIHGDTYNTYEDDLHNEMLIFIGDSKTNFRKGKNNINNKMKAIGNSILEHGDLFANLEDDEISIKSYGSHKHRFKEESHKGSADVLDDHEEKRDACKEELGIDEGNNDINN